MDEIKTIWRGDISFMRNVMKNVKAECGKNVTFPFYFKDKAMMLSGGDEVEYGSEIYFYVEDDRPKMEIAMPRSKRNVVITLLVEKE